MRWILVPLLTLAFLLVGLPALSASAAATGVISGTVTFQEQNPTRTLEVYRETDGVWSEDVSLRTPIAADGTYTVTVPAGEPVELRASYGDPTYGYYYGDAFGPENATPVQAAAGESVGDIDLTVPAPAFYSGHLTDRGGNPEPGTVIPTANTSGMMESTIATPIRVESDGTYSVILPAGYEDGVMGTDTTGNTWSWLGGGTGYDPDWYINPTAGQVATGQDIALPIGAQSSAPQPSQSATKLRATHSPVVRGTVRKGHQLRSTTGAFNKHPSVVRYQWLRNGKAIRGATRASYKLRKADVRKRISVRVTAWRSGSKTHVTSARTAKVRAH